MAKRFVLLFMGYPCLGHKHMQNSIRIVCRPVFPCPSPLFSLMGEACNLTFLFILRIFLLNMKFFSYYFGLCLEWFHRLHIWSLTSSLPVFIFPFVSWLWSFSAQFWYFGGGWPVSDVEVALCADMFEHILQILHKRIFTDTEINKIYFLHRSIYNYKHL